MISSLGLIEVVGLVGAIEAADTAVKAANVRVIDYELTKGGGMVTVKIEGEVSAVKAAVDAAVMAAERLTTVVSQLVIARPSEEVAKMVEVEELVPEEETAPVVEEKAPEVIEKVEEVKPVEAVVESSDSVKKKITTQKTRTRSTRTRRTKTTTKKIEEE